MCSFFSCGGKTRTCDLQVMSLASYQLLHSAILTMIKQAFPVLRVQRYDYFSRYANFYVSFFVFTIIYAKKLVYFKQKPYFCTR